MALAAAQVRLDFSFSAQETDIARLVSHIPTGPVIADPVARGDLVRRFNKPFFLCTNLDFLRERFAALSSAVEEHRLLDGRKLDRRKISDAAMGKGISLSQICKLNQALLAAERHPDPNINVLAQRGGAPYAMEENSVFLSDYYVDRERLRDHRRGMGFSRDDLSRLIYDHENPLSHSFFHNLQQGEEEKDKRKMRYRVTRNTAEAIHFLLGVLHHYFPSKASAAPVPAFSDLFDNDPNAGPKDGQNTTVMSVAHGNRLMALSLEEKKAIVERARVLAHKRGEPPVPIFTV